MNESVLGLYFVVLVAIIFTSYVKPGKGAGEALARSIGVAFILWLGIQTPMFLHIVVLIWCLQPRRRCTS
jgi:hypothetical protein